MVVSGIAIELVLHGACGAFAYVSDGSFISQAGRSLSGLPRPEGRSPKLGVDGGPTAAAMPEEEFLYRVEYHRLLSFGK